MTPMKIGSRGYSLPGLRIPRLRELGKLGELRELRELGRGNLLAGRE
jgi:hypothetical protein